MKVFVSADLEGIWGVVSKQHLGGDHPDYTRARRLMTREVNLVCEKLFRHGATEVVVNDAHGPMDNLLIEELHPDVSLVSGYPKELSMMEGLNETFDCAMLIGCHPKAGTEQGIFDHTYAGSIVNALYVNDQELGESGLNALVAGHFGVPVVLVAGDDKITRDVLQEIGPIETVPVKTAISRYCARNLSLNQLQAAYEEAIGKALNEVSRYPVKKPDTFLLKLRLTQPVMVDKVTAVPGVERLDSFSVVYRAADAVDLYRVFRAMVTMAASVM